MQKRVMTIRSLSLRDPEEKMLFSNTLKLTSLQDSSLVAERSNPETSVSIWIASYLIRTKLVTPSLRGTKQSRYKRLNLDCFVSYKDETCNSVIARYEAIQIQATQSGLLRSAYNDEVVNQHIINRSGLLPASCLAVRNDSDLYRHHSFLHGIFPMPAARNDGDRLSSSLFFARDLSRDRVLQ